MAHFDIIIIGGGIVGATAACALGQAGVPVALIEAREPVAPGSQQPDPRVFAITRASERIFRSLGVWDAIHQSGGAFAFSDMEVWDASGDGLAHFDCADLGEPCLGHIIEPRFIQAALWRQLESIATVSLYCPARFQAITILDDRVEVDLDNAQQLTAELVVAADGARSPVRNALGMETHAHDYRQSSLVALVKTSEPHRDTAWQRFLPGGPLAFLPMGGGWSSIVWTMPSDKIERLLTADRDVFHEELAVAFGHRLGDIVDSGEREAWPLQRMHAEHYVDARVALIGDAAHAIHPLAGQGVNLGLLDAAALAEVIVDAKQRGKDPGRLAVLRRYERWRRGDNLLMMTAMDGINQIFSKAGPPLSQARNLGLSMVNRSGMAKRLFMEHAMGLGGDLPKLATVNEEVSSSD
ncbi:MAG: UbiH/UbiF/VisC/COQ6 family ubiquinone biosynthesis hydroxylase [Pseudomonadota bacterium]